MKIIVTGAAGFLGSHIVDGLLENGHDVVGIDNLSGGFRQNVNPKARFRAIDLRDAVKAARAIQETQPEAVYHLAACAREGASQFQPLYVTETNLLAYMNVLVPSIKCGVKKIVLFSSMSVYGCQAPPFSEEMKRLPEDIYAVNKASMERSTEILSSVHGFDWVIIRPHNCFGERQSLRDKFRNVVGIFMNRCMRNEPLYVYGDGEQVRAFSYIYDSLGCYLRCLSKDISKEIVNIGGTKPITINRLAEEVLKHFPNSKSRIKYLPERPCEVKVAYCENKKAEKLLGYKEIYGWKEGVAKMAAWAKNVGPCEWSDDKMEIEADCMPILWK